MSERERKRDTERQREMERWTERVRDVKREWMAGR